MRLLHYTILASGALFRGFFYWSSGEGWDVTSRHSWRWENGICRLEKGSWNLVSERPLRRRLAIRLKSI